MTRTSAFRGALAVFAFVALVGCGVSAAPAPSDESRTVDQREATEMAEQAFQALNDRDYAGWSEHWSAGMKAAITEEHFLAFRDEVVGSLGRYVEIRNVEATSVQPGTYRYTFTLAFEQGEAKLAFGFLEGSDLIQGVFVV